jgi:hypothetical protein
VEAKKPYGTHHRKQKRTGSLSLAALKATYAPPIYQLSHKQNADNQRGLYNPIAKVFYRLFVV